MTQNDHKRNTADVLSSYPNPGWTKGPPTSTNALPALFLQHQANGTWIE
jgi:hypothetical protein